VKPADIAMIEKVAPVNAFPSLFQLTFAVRIMLKIAKNITPYFYRLAFIEIHG